MLLHHLEFVVILYIYPLENYEAYQLSSGNAGALLIQSLERGGQSVLVAEIQCEVYHLGGPHLGGSPRWICKSCCLFLESIIIVTILLYL